MKLFHFKILYLILLSLYVLRSFYLRFILKVFNDLKNILFLKVLNLIINFYLFLGLYQHLIQHLINLELLLKNLNLKKRIMVQLKVKRKILIQHMIMKILLLYSLEFQFFFF